VVPEELMKSLQMPPMLTCGPAANSLTQVELWLSMGGTASFLHDHQDHQLHCLKEGRKDIILFDPEHRHLLHMKDSYKNSKEGKSIINTEMVNMVEHRSIVEAPWQFASLVPGQCIFIPAHYAHQVRSYGRSLSYTIQWRPTLSSVEAEAQLSKDCSVKWHHRLLAKDVASVSLQKFQFMWTQRDGVKQLSDKSINEEGMLRLLILLLDNDDQLPQERFEHWFASVMHVKKLATGAKADMVWQLLQSMVSGTTKVQVNKALTRQQLAQLPKSAGALERLASVINGARYSHRDEL